jgi:hypothetical protein
MSDNVKTFKATLERHYAYLFGTEEYKVAANITTPEKLADRMTQGLKEREANKEGEGIKRTCKKLNIKYTYKAIAEFLNG